MQSTSEDTQLDQELSVPSEESASVSAQSMYNEITPGSTVDGQTVVELIIYEINDGDLDTNSYSSPDVGIAMAVAIPILIVVILVIMVAILRSRARQNMIKKKIKDQQDVNLS